jgi:DNA-binding transcriptional LysR family regulator
MKEWDDIRFFLAVARKGSVTGAGAQLGVNHSTVSRRLSALETRLGVRLFERLPTGYALTPGGEEILGKAEKMEDAAIEMNRKVLGRDQRLSGTVRLTAPVSTATTILFPEIADFAATYPDIEIQLVGSDNVLSLTRREADIAIRVTNRPEENLFGRKLAQIAYAVYGSTSQPAPSPDTPCIAWDDEITWDFGTSPPASIKTLCPNTRVAFRANTDELRVASVSAGLGIAELPCYVGDTDSRLKRLSEPAFAPGWDFWLLTHKDLRATARFRAVLDFAAKTFARKRALIEGHAASA